MVVGPRGTLWRARAIMIGSAGNLVEWYDWYAYAAFTLYFAKVFFPRGDQTGQLLQAAGVFAVGFAARPVGAWLMGMYADRAGRRAALTLSVAMMSAGSLAIAVLPGRGTIGLAAPVLLVLARVFQGLSIGGEYGASATYMSEVADAAHRGFWSSFQAATMIAGQLLALVLLIVLQQVLNDRQMVGWGWRIPFVIGAALAVSVFWLRRTLDESPSFVALSQPRSVRPGSAQHRCVPPGAAALWRAYPRESLTILGLTAAGTLPFYIYTVYMQKYLVNTARFGRGAATEIAAVSLLGFIAAQPLFGWLADRFGRRTMLAIAYGGGAVAIWPVLAGVAGTRSPLVAGGLILAALMIQSAYTAVAGVVKADLFPAELRALGVALPYALGTAIFGGTAEYVALWFKSAGIERGFYAYAGAILLVGLVLAITMRDTRAHSLIDRDVTGRAEAEP